MSNNFNPRIHIGETHGVYTIVDMLPNKDKYGHYIYKGICNECGYERFSHYGGFSGEKSITRICNHLYINGNFIKNTVWDNKRIGSIFRGIKARCYNLNNKAYRWYGAKGIEVCDEWLKNPKLFEEWSVNNGYSDELTIDRIDENKDYCPENCRWVTNVNNAKYKSTTSLIEVDNETHTGKEWANVLGFGVNVINTYIRKYGIENVIEFIRRFKKNPTLKPKNRQSYYDLYMS